MGQILSIWQKIGRKLILLKYSHQYIDIFL